MEQQRNAGVDMASVSGRTELVGEYVEFLDVDVPLSITAGFAVMGSLIMLTLIGVVTGQVDLTTALADGTVNIDGDPAAVANLVGLAPVDADFNIVSVTPTNQDGTSASAVRTRRRADGRARSGVARGVTDSE